MSRNNTWKLLIVLFVVLWSVYELTPPSARDLIGEFKRRAENTDAAFATIVANAEKLQAQSPDRAYQNLSGAVGTNDITRYFTNSIKKSLGSNPTRTILNQLQRDGAGQIKLGLDLQGGTAFTVVMDQKALVKAESNGVGRASIQKQAIEVLRKRVDRFGVAEPLIQPQGDDRILIQIPGMSEAENANAREQLRKAAFLEFRIVHPRSAQLLADDIIEPGYEKLFEKRTDDKKQEVLVPILVKIGAEQGMTGEYVTKAYPQREDMTGKWQIAFSLDAKGTALFRDITTRHAGEFLAIVLDGELYSAPRINSPITQGNGVITGDFSLEEALGLANTLENPLATPVSIADEERVEPSLGKENISSGIRAAIYGTIAVAAFMLVYYLAAGAVANVALLLNILILFGVLCHFDVTLTLPGIAGIVLTIGMAVDANVLIYERIREELAAGKSIRGAVSAGYDRAFGTIFDSNLTTLIASTLLIYLGTGSVKGFGVALTIGVTVSMFTALIVTRLIFDNLLQRDLISNLKMLQLVRGSGIDFMKFAKPAFAATWILILVGLIAGGVRGKGVMGVDLAGGDETLYGFAQRVDNDKLSSSLSDLVVNGKKLGETTVQYKKSVTDAAEQLRVVSPAGTGAEIAKHLAKTFPASKFEAKQTRNVGAVIGSEILKSALLAVALALFGILVYVAFRYEFTFAIGAVVAIIHDILMTLGIYFLAGRELNATMIAAVLTIIGFSINDTIVIFDRIREDLKLGVRGSFKDIINQALNQTLSRTIITSGTVFLATLSLFLFGGGAINDFAFTFLVGILTGTYSSVYIASAIVLWLNKGERPKTRSLSADAVVAAQVPAAA